MSVIAVKHTHTHQAQIQDFVKGRGQLLRLNFANVEKQSHASGASH